MLYGPCAAQVLETESAITMEAKAALEEAHREMERVKRDLMNDMKKLEVG